MKSFLSPPKHKAISKVGEALNKAYQSKREQVFTGIFIGYAGFYLVRKNFTLAMPELVKMGFTKGDLGFALSANAIAYGLSKFVMGGISDRSDARKFLALGLILTSLVTIVAGTSIGMSSITMMFVLQFLIGWFQGMGWPPCGRVMTHWFSQKERGTWMSFWNVAHNVGGGLLAPLVGLGTTLLGWKLGTFFFPAAVAIILAVISYLLVRDTPQSEGLPSIEEYKNDYPESYSKDSEKELTTKEIFFKYVLSNKTLWFIAFANAFVYLVRYGVLDWAPTYLQNVKHYNVKEAGWAYAMYEWAAIPGTIICGFISDKVFKGKRAVPTIIFMALVLVFVLIYWHSDSSLILNLSLIAIGFLIYGPVMLIGVQALDLAPKKAAGTAAGLTGLLGYLVGTAILANIALGYFVDLYGWNAGFYMLIAACILSIVFMAFTYKEENKKTKLS